MAKQRLKCWRKVKKGWETKKGTVHTKKTIDLTKKKLVDGTNYHLSGPGLFESFKTKSKALKRAKSYMKKHDVC